MQTRSRTRSEPEEVPLQFNHERTRVPTAPIEPRDNSHKESLQRRIAELEAQLRTATMQTLHYLCNRTLLSSMGNMIFCIFESKPIQNLPGILLLLSFKYSQRSS